MAGIERLKRTQDLKMDQLVNIAEGNRQKIFMRYDDLSDTLVLLFVSPDIKTIVHYIDEHVALLYRPENNEVVGIQVENFETSFIDEYANIQKAWRLSDCCKDLSVQNLGDISLLIERQKPVMAQELAIITKNLLFKRRRRRERVAA